MINSIYKERNFFKTKKSISVLMKRMERMKYGNIISIPNPNLLQKKAKKMLNNFKLEKMMKFKILKMNLKIPKKKFNLELLIFKKNLKALYIIHLNKLDIIILNIKIMIIFL